jgi:hypothetical protein
MPPKVIHAMSDPKSSEPSELSAETQKLPAINLPVKEDSEEFLAGQEEVRKMIAAGVPLNEILSKLVLMIESQTPDMLGSILLLSDDGNHVRHAVAPSLPESYVKVIDGSPIGPKHGSCGTAMFRGSTGDSERYSYRSALGRLPPICKRDWYAGLLVYSNHVEQRQSARFVCDVLSRASQSRR